MKSWHVRLYVSGTDYRLVEAHTAQEAFEIAKDECISTPIVADIYVHDYDIEEQEL